MEPPQEPTPTREIQLISDGDGLAVIGKAANMKRFLAEEGLAAEGPNTKDLGLARFRDMLGIGSAAAQAWAEVAANTGRWVKLTKDTAGAAKKYGLMKSKETGLDLGVVYAKGEAAGIKRLVQFEKGPGSLLNPSSISGVAGIMSQMAMQQAMDEITDYLASMEQEARRRASRPDQRGALTRGRRAPRHPGGHERARRRWPSL